MKNKKRKVAVIGMGVCGRGIVMALTLMDAYDEIVLINHRPKKAFAEAVEARSIASCTAVPKIIRAGTFEDCGDAGMVILANGAASATAGLSREENYQETVKRYKDSLDPIMAAGFNGLVFVMTYQEERACQYVSEITGLPDEKIFAIGYEPYTVGLRNDLAAKYDVDFRDIQTAVVGAQKVHMAFASQTKVNGKTVMDYEELQDFCVASYKDGFKVIEDLEAYDMDSYNTLCAGVAKAFLNDEKSVHVLCVKCHGEYGIYGQWCSLPIIAGKHGIEHIIQYDVTQQESKALVDSANLDSFVNTGIEYKKLN